MKNRFLRGALVFLVAGAGMACGKDKPKEAPSAAVAPLPMAGSGNEESVDRPLTDQELSEKVREEQLTLTRERAIQSANQAQEQHRQNLQIQNAINAAQKAQQTQ